MEALVSVLPSQTTSYVGFTFELMSCMVLQCFLSFLGVRVEVMTTHTPKA